METTPTRRRRRGKEDIRDYSHLLAVDTNPRYRMPSRYASYLLTTHASATSPNEVNHQRSFYVRRQLTELEPDENGDEERSKGKGGSKGLLLRATTHFELHTTCLCRTDASPEVHQGTLLVVCTVTGLWGTGSRIEQVISAVGFVTTQKKNTKINKLE